MTKRVLRRRAELLVEGISGLLGVGAHARGFSAQRAYLGEAETPQAPRSSPWERQVQGLLNRGSRASSPTYHAKGRPQFGKEGT
jgi:hypothetical protein